LNVLFPANVKHFEAVLNSLIRLSTEDDPQVQKHCVGSLAKMIELWTEPPTPTESRTGPAAVNGKPHGFPGFNQFILQRILPLCFQLPFKRSFNLNDGQAYLVSLFSFSFLFQFAGWTLKRVFFFLSFFLSLQILGEICNLKKLMLLKLGPEFLQYMQGTFLPSVGLAPQASTEYLQALQAPDAKAFTKYFKVCFSLFLFPFLSS